MASAAKRVAYVCGIAAFCACLLAGLLTDCMPLTAAKRALLAGGVFAVMSWLCARVALNLIRASLRRNNEEVKP